jgi:hypothetical protein
MRRSGTRCRPTTYKGAGIPIYKPFPKMQAGSTKVPPRIGCDYLSHLWNEATGVGAFYIANCRLRRDHQSRNNCSAGPTLMGAVDNGCLRTRALMDQPSAAVLRHGGGLGRRGLTGVLPWPPGGRTDPPSVVRRTLHPSRRIPCISLLTCLPPGKANPDL